MYLYLLLRIVIQRWLRMSRWELHRRIGWMETGHMVGFLQWLGEEKTGGEGDGRSNGSHWSWRPERLIPVWAACPSFTDYPSPRTSESYAFPPPGAIAMPFSSPFLPLSSPSISLHLLLSSSRTERIPGQLSCDKRKRRRHLQRSFCF